MVNKTSAIASLAVLILTAGIFDVAHSKSRQKEQKEETHEGGTGLASAASMQILEKSEGERRVRRLAGNRMGTTPFILKVDPKNGASQNLVMFTEDLPAGATIPWHKHPGTEEIVVLETGTSRVHLGNSVRDVGPGSTVFAPPGTWISVENIGKDPVSLIAVFSEPGFEEYMRAISVLEGEKNTQLSKEELDAIRKAHPHSVVYK